MKNHVGAAAAPIGNRYSLQGPQLGVQLNRFVLFRFDGAREGQRQSFLQSTESGNLQQRYEFFRSKA